MVDALNDLAGVQGEIIRLKARVAFFGEQLGPEVQES
jgi:hypothetical protein